MSNNRDSSHRSEEPPPLENFVQYYDASDEEILNDDDENMEEFHDTVSEADHEAVSEYLNSKKRVYQKIGTFEEWKLQKLCYDGIADAMASMKDLHVEAAYWCCKMLCYTWLTTNLVYFCRLEGPSHAVQVIQIL